MRKLYVMEEKEEEVTGILNLQQIKPLDMPNLECQMKKIK